MKLTLNRGQLSTGQAINAAKAAMMIKSLLLVRRLIGLIQHIGSMGGGHYISYCQHKRKPQARPETAAFLGSRVLVTAAKQDWYEFDDVQVTCVTSEQDSSSQPS